MVMGANAQNLVQNPGFENLPKWDSLWFLDGSPSLAGAEATQITADAHEGTTCIQLSNIFNTNWTYFQTDTFEAPLRFRASKSYEIRGWLRSVEQGKKVDFTVYWNGSQNSFIIYSGNPDPVVKPDWFTVNAIITPTANFADGYLRLGLRATKDANKNGAGKLLIDDFSVVRIPADSDADILDFSIPEQDLPPVIDDFSGTIDLKVPFGTDLSALVPDLITLSAGASVSPGVGIPQDFSVPVVYTVTASDGISTLDWKVTVAMQPNTETAITGFAFVEQTGPAVINDPGSEIFIEVAFGTDLSLLVPTITLSYGATVTPGSGTANNFIGPASYTVTAEDGITTRDWTITVSSEPPNTETDITGFVLDEQDSVAVIDPASHTVDVNVPYGTNLTALVPVISISNGATVDPASGAGVDFSGPVTYTVTAQDGITIQAWTVSVHLLPNTETDFTGFVLAGQTAPAAIDTSNHTVDVIVPFGTDLTALVPVITLSDGATVDPPSGTVADFTNPVTYTVTAQDGTTIQTWNISAHLLPNTETDITGFVLAGQTAPAAIDTSNHTVDVIVPFGTDLTALVPVITLSDGATVDPPSETATDFSGPVTYTVTAQDGLTTREWIVHVILSPPSTETDITGFFLEEQVSVAEIDRTSHTVKVEVPFGTDLTALLPSITLSEGATVDPPSGTVADFTNPVTYTVTAQDGTTIQTWIVSVHLLPNTETDITEFSLSEQTGPSNIDPVNHTVAIEVSKETDIRALTPSISISQGATINPASGVTLDFTDVVDYIVTAEDRTASQSWMVRVSLDPALGLRDGGTETNQVFPNPSTEFIHLDLKEKADIILLDMTGNPCLRLDNIEGGITINISLFKRGIYLLRITQPDGTLQISKLIIQ
jgi:hypothetical protein